MDESERSTNGQLLEKIERLEGELEAARLQLERDQSASDGELHKFTYQGKVFRNAHNLHSLLLIADSALPLGSFAFSSGLESFLAHKPKQSQGRLLSSFISLSLASVSRLSLPYLCRAYQSPHELLSLDNDFDACTPCTVARRASIAQGRALVTTWERSFRMSAGGSAAAEALAVLSAELKLASQSNNMPIETSGHLPPVFGAVAAALDIDLRETVHVFLLNHVKAVLSAGVRAGILGPFQAQAYLMTPWIRKEIEEVVKTVHTLVVERAGQVWVPGDIWIGRHELLYSRIFNS